MKTETPGKDSGTNEDDSTPASGFLLPVSSADPGHPQEGKAPS